MEYNSEHQKNANTFLGVMIAELINKYISDMEKTKKIDPDNHYQIGYRLCLVHVINDLHHILKGKEENGKED